MGPSFEKGLRTVGRRRLPDGVVAILDDHETLRAAIRELHAYAIQNRSRSRQRRAIIFRVVNAGERQAFLAKLSQFFGPKNLSIQESIYGFEVGHFHFVDDSFMSHVTSRHSIETVPGHVAVTVDDLVCIPEIVNPKWIVNFRFIKKMPRIIYERRYDRSTIVVVQEIQANAGLSVKTIYKKK
ncbi:MAG: hypothetical protein ABSB42_22940 [Tepidisphaeraceae bacterium]